MKRAVAFLQLLLRRKVSIPALANGGGNANSKKETFRFASYKGRRESRRRARLHHSAPCRVAGLQRKKVFPGSTPRGHCRALLAFLSALFRGKPFGRAHLQELAGRPRRTQAERVG